MASEYEVTAVSQEEPREWNGPNGLIYYIKAKVLGHEKPLDVGKKTRDGLKVGDKIYGIIEPTDYVTDKFKSASRPMNQGQPQEKKDWQPRDDEAIKAQMAIKASVQLWASNKDWTIEDVEATAKELMQMIDRVKGGSESTNPKPSTNLGEQTAITTSPSGYDKFKQTGGSFKASEIPVDDLPPLTEEELARANSW